MPPPDFKTAIETIRDHNEISDVIGSYVQLKRAGNSLKGLCPFHKEKTPSFHVNPSRQSFHCFGCGAGGDVFNFVMRYENVDFIQAARSLAERANLPLDFDRESSGAKNEPSSIKGDLIRLHAQLAEWYQRCLRESGQAATARTYLSERDIDDATAEAFGIGYAPARDMNWKSWADKRSFDMELLITAGVVIRKDTGGWYDRFADRLMFPIHDESGRVIGFSGRVLPGDTRETGKYVNSPETPLFTKSKIFYALHLAKREILNQKEAIVCEGQIDVIRCHTAGIKNAVAAQGTAITEDHARILRRFTDAVRLVLDSDDAGKNAAMRSAEVLLAAGLNVHIASLPPGDDPDSLIRREGSEAFIAATVQALPALEFQIDTLLSREAKQDDAAMLRVARAVMETISRVSSDLQREQLLQRASTRLGIRPDILASELRQFMRRRMRAEKEPEEQNTSPSGQPNHPREEMELIRLLIHHPESGDVIAHYIEPGHLTSPTCRRIYGVLMEHGLEEHFDLMAELLTAGEEERRLAALLAAENRFAGTEFDTDKAAQDLIIAIRKRDFEGQRRQLDSRRRNASGEEAKQLDLEIYEITMHQHTLRTGWENARKMLDVHRSLSGM
ncbi:MAG TPA: DNA primase [Kiritimatiellia bacterium]|nr:DNA primase [Kiritimatiellia bacterium]